MNFQRSKAEAAAWDLPERPGEALRRPQAERRQPGPRRDEDLERQRLAECALYFRSVLDAVAVAIVGLSAEGTIRSWNRAAQDLFGYAEGEVLNRSIDLLRAPDHPCDHADPPPAGACRWQAVKRRRDGSCLRVSIDSAPLPDCDGATWMIRDLREDLERERREQSLREQALTDPLTGVANRRRLGQVLRAETRRANREGTPLTLVFADLDDFKQVNDELGHVQGDRALKLFAALVQSQLRGYDLLARAGGDEFVILMPNTTREEACACVERIRGRLEQTPVAGLSRPLTASFGIAERDPGEGVEAQLRRTDRALYQAKSSGKNCAVRCPA